MRRAARIRAGIALIAAGVASLVLGSCGERRCQSYSCGQQTTCVRYATEIAASAEIAFEGCGPDGCGEAVTGVSGGRIGPSYHPSEHALWLDAGGEARLRFVLSRASTGSVLLFTARCDRGARLHASSATPGVGFDVQFSTGTTWRSVRQTLVSPTPVVTSAPLERTVREVVLRVEGAGTCQIDRARLEAVDLRCAQSVVTVTQCETCEYSYPGSGSSTGTDSGWRLDAGRREDLGVVDARDDGGPAERRDARGEVAMQPDVEDASADGPAEDVSAAEDATPDASEDAPADATADSPDIAMDADAHGAEDAPVDATADGGDAEAMDAGG